MEQVTTSGNSDLRSRLQLLKQGAYIENSYQPSSYRTVKIGSMRMPLAYEYDFMAKDEDEPVKTMEDYENDEVEQDSINTDNNSVIQEEYKDSVINKPFVEEQNVKDYNEEEIDTLVVEDATPTQTKKENSRGVLGAVADAVFSVVEGAIDTMIKTPSGEMLLNNKKLDELKFQKEFLELEKEMRASWRDLNNAYLAQDTEKIRTIYPEYQALLTAYQQMYDSYKTSAKKYFEYAYQPTADERIAALDKGMAELDKNNEELNEDIQAARYWMDLSNSIYKPSDWWLQKEQESWLYQIPRGLGTSATSLGAMAVSFATQAAANYAINQVAASPLGPLSPYVAGGAALLGAGVTTATSIWARDMESLAEVAGAYEQRVLEFAQQKGIDTEALANIGREQLTQITGKDYSEADAKTVFQDMLTYDVATGDPDIDFARAESKKGLNTIYNRNMMLAASDVAQQMIVIPGVGKMFGKVIDKLDVPNSVINGTVKLMDKTIEKVAPKISNINRTKLINYAVDPAVRLGVTSTMEGVEEATQLLISRDSATLTDEQELELGNPIDMFRMFAENNHAAIKGFMGVLGISPDQALNNDKELKDNFKVGAAIGLIMGGAPQLYEANTRRKSFNAGQELGRRILTEYVKDKEDMYKYIEYGKRAMSGSRKEDFMQAIDLQLEEGAIPSGWTAEEIEAEKNNISDIYDIIRHNPLIKELKEKDNKAISAAYIKLLRDKYNDQVSSYVELRNSLDRNLIEEDLNDFFFNNQNKILNPLKDDERARNLIKSYMIYQAQLDKINSIIKHYEAVKDKDQSVINLLDLMYSEKAEHEKNISSIRTRAKALKINQFLSKANLVKSNDAVSNYYFDELMARTGIEETVKTLNKVTSDSKALLKAAKKYQESLIPEPQEETTEPVVENETNISDDEVEAAVVVTPSETESETKTEEGNTVEETTDSKGTDSIKPTVDVTEGTSSETVKNNVSQLEKSLDDTFSFTSDEYIKRLSGSDSSIAKELYQNYVHLKEDYNNGNINDEWYVNGLNTIKTELDEFVKPYAEINKRYISNTVQELDRIKGIVEKQFKDSPNYEELKSLLEEANKIFSTFDSGNVKTANNVRAELTKLFYKVKRLIGNDSQIANEIKVLRDNINKQRSTNIDTSSGHSQIKADTLYSEVMKNINAQLQLLGEQLMPELGVNTYQEYQIQRAIDDYDGDNTIADDWNDLRILRDNLEEAVIDGDIDTANRLVQEINNFINNSLGIEPEEETNSILYQASSEDLNNASYEDMYQESEGLSERDFSEEYDAHDSGETENHKEEIIEDNSAPDEIDDNEPNTLPEQPGIDSNTKKYTDKEIDESIELDQDNREQQVDESDEEFQPERMEGTLYFRVDAAPMMNGYNNNSDLVEYLNVPGNVAKAKYYVIVGAPDSQYGSYDPADIKTWDNAAIYVEIITPNGKKFITALKTPQGIISMRRAKGLDTTDADLASFREFRRQILELHHSNPDSRIKLDAHCSSGLISKNRNADGTVINRKLTDISGLNMPKDLHDLESTGIQFGIGKGIIDNFIIMDSKGMPLPGRGGSGRIFIYPASKDMLNGKTLPIQLNESRFADENGNPTELAEYFAKVILYRETGNEILDAGDLIRLGVNYSQSTLVDPADRRYQFLADKQFYFNYKKGWAQLGRKRYDIAQLRVGNGLSILTKFIADNLHWNTDKTLLFNSLPESLKTYAIENNLKSFKLAEGLEFDMEDLGLIYEDGQVKEDTNSKGLSTLAWMIKRGKIQSDLQDSIMVNPFVYVSNPRIEVEIDPEQQAVETEASQPINDTFDLYTAVQGSEEDAQTTTDVYTDANSQEISDFFGFDGPEMRMTRNQMMQQKRVNTKKAVKWLKRTLGLTNEQIEIVDGVIREFANGSAVYGVARRDSIAISDQAIEGVQYHEAWHRVSLLMLDKETRTKLYNEFRKQHPEFRSLDNKQLEEEIADRFMDYMLNDKESAFRYYITKLFRNIKKFLHINASLNPSDLDSIFDAIKYGDFRKHALDKESYNEFVKAYESGAYYKVGPDKEYTPVNFPTLAEFDSAIDSLKACMFIANGAKYISDISNLSEDKLKALIESYSKSNRVTVEQKKALNEILEHFDVFMYELRPKLQQMGIRAIDRDADEEMSKREEGAKPSYDKASFEYDKKNNALASVKMFIATLSDTYFEYKKVDGVNVRTMKTRINKVTGLPMIVDYDTAYALIAKNLSTVESFHSEPGQDPETSLVGRCARLAKSSPFFQFLYKRLTQPMDMNLQTQILQTVKSFDQNFIEVAFFRNQDGEITFEVKDSINKRATKIYPSTWSDMFFNSEMVIRTDDSTVANKEAINEVIDEFREIYNYVDKNRKQMSNTDVDEQLSKFVKVLNKIRIDVDVDTIESMFGSDRIESFAELILNNNKGAAKYLFESTLNEIANGKKDLKTRSKDKQAQLDRVFMGLGKDSFINRLAEAQSFTHPSDTELSVLGPNNSVMFTKTQNCYASDVIRWLNNKDEQIITQLNADPYCKSSRILNVINNDGKVKLNTFVNFYGEGVNDKGRDYLSISPVEDYIAKMTFTYANHIIFPTMADKKTWFTISGVKLFNKELYLSLSKTGKVNVKFNYEALSQLYNYWLDEYNTIVEYYNSLPGLTKADMIKNYHTSGKGGLFRHFTGYYANVDGQIKWIDLNAALKEASKNGMDDVKQLLDEIKETLFTNKSETLNKINDILHKQLEQEIKTCENLGIIERDKNGKLVNKLLDAKVFNHFKEIYQQHSLSAVSDNAERYAIITMIGNHMINNNVSVIETEKIITGDVAFFKNDDDKIKRLGSVLSTGDNLRTQWYYENNAVDKTSYDYLKDRQTYTATVINDNEIPSAQYEQLKQMFTFAYIRNLLAEKEGLSEKEIDELMKDQDAAREKYEYVFELAEKLADDDASAYGMNDKGTKGNVNQADAAVYISPRMYRNIVQMLGEWSNEIAEAFDIMESDIDWLSDPVLYAKTLKTLIKPLKTTYFGYTYDAKLKHNVPVFNKMAMFPMFKVLAKGDNLELYNRMNALGKYKGLEPIDQVAFESAVKVGIKGPTDFYKDYTNEEINDLGKMVVTKQYFRNLRRQLITDPHTHDRTLFGTQVSTVAVSNLIMDRVYGENKGQKITGREVKERLFGTINAISDIGFATVRDMFLDENGNLDYEKTSKQLIKEAKASNMGKDVENALALNEDGTDFKIPLAALPDSKWVETKIISTNNKKSIDLELPGGAFIQMSSFGVKQIGVKSSRLLNVREDGSMDAIISINLFSHIIPDYKNKSFTEARQWLIDNGIIGENAGSVAMGYRIPTQGLSSIAGLHIKDVLPSIVGDTIVLPDEFTAQTGSDFDIDKLYIARYNYEIVEEYIDAEDVFERWYNQHLVMTGSDNGGKKTLMSQYGNKTNAREYFVKENRDYKIVDDKTVKVTKRAKKVEFTWDENDPQSSYKKNSKEANENLLLETYLMVLTDNKNVDETRLPLDKVTGIIKNEILPIVDSGEAAKEFIPMNELSPTYQMNKKYEYSGGKTGIAPFALNNKNHVLTQLTNLKFAQNNLLEALGFTGLDGIKSMNERVAERDKKTKQIILDEEGNVKYVNEEGLRILDWISAMINAHVDVAKDPYVIRLNVRQYTYNMCNFLLRVGFGKNTFFFLPQQILKEMALAYDRAQGIYGIDETKSKTSIINEEMKKIRQRYFKEYSDYCKALRITPELNLTKSGDLQITGGSIVNYASDIMQRDFLIEQLFNKKNFKTLSTKEQMNYMKNQLLISELFLQLNMLADDMSKLVQLSQVDTKKFGNNFVDHDRFVYRLKSLMVNTVLFDADSIQEYLDETFLSTKIDNGLIKPARMFEDIMIRSKQSFKDIISQILMMIGRIDSTDSELNKIISNELEAQIRSKYLESKDNYEMFYGTNTMAKRLSKIKIDILNGVYPEMLTQDGKIANQLLNYLGVLTRMSTDTYAAPDIIIRNRMSEDDKYLKQNLISYWEELLESPHEEVRKFARDLFIYELITTGGNFNKHGIFNLIPISLIIENGYAEFMRQATVNFVGRDIDFDNFFLNNWQNNKIVKTIEIYENKLDEEGRTIKVAKFPILNSKNKFLSANVRIPIVLQPNAVSFATNASKQPLFTPYIKYKVPGGKGNPEHTLLYKFVGIIPNEKGTVNPLYVLVNKKGLNQGGRVVKEYDDYSNSMFDFNNLDIALDAKNMITVDDVRKFIMNNAFFTNDRTKNDWIKRISEMDEITDNKPITKALTSNLRSIKKAKKVVRVLGQSIYSNMQEEHSQAEEVNDVNVDDRPEPNSKSLTFTFPDNITIDIPFQLNKQQEDALNGLFDFIKDPSKYGNMITLEGYAGTGKTTIIGIFDQYLMRTGRRPIYSSPTHRANAVTAQNNPNAEVVTLHSLFGLSPRVDLEDGTYDLRKLKTEQVRNAKLKPGQLLIVDEASMVSTGLYDFIQDFVKEEHVRVIFVGDPAQLSPVKDSTISPVFTREGATILKLTKVERTGDNPILEEATNLRNGKPLSYVSKVSDGEGVEYMHDDYRPNEVITQIINSEEYKKNPFYFRILSATNAMLPTANERVRKMLYGNNPKQIMVGEVLMGFSNVRDTRNNLTIANSIDYVVVSVEEGFTTIEGMKLKGFNTTLKTAAGESGLTNIFILSNDIPEADIMKIANAIEKLERELDLAFKNRNYSNIDMLSSKLAYLKRNTITMKNFEVNGKLKLQKALDYGYAHTIHKSQGGTYDKVMIYEDTINGAAFEADVKQQLRYVAVSRAKHNVYVVTSREFTDNSPSTPTTSETKIPKVFYSKFNYSRQLVEDDPRTLYIFTDNTERTSHGKPVGEGWYRDKYQTEGVELGYGTDRNPTTAIIRGLDNAAPISTVKWFYRNHMEGTDKKAELKAREISLWTDADYNTVEAVLDDEINDIKLLWDSGDFDKVVFPRQNEGGDGIINGKISKIDKQRTPRLYNLFQSKIKELKEYINGYAEPEETVTTETSKPTIASSEAEVWSMKEGWSVAHYNSKVLPRIQEAWQFEYKLTDNSAIPKYTINMNYDYNGDKRPEVKANSTLEAIKNGERTATTRYESDQHIGYLKQLKVGDIIRFVKKNKQGEIIDEVKAVVTRELHPLSNKSVQSKPAQLALPMPSEFKCHSGGADGADFMWGEIGKEYGLPEANHYQHPEKMSPHGNISISSQDIQEGRYKVAEAAKSNYGYQYATMKDGNLIRDWAQVKYSDAIYAVGHIVRRGEKLFPNQSNDTRVALHAAVTGGTGYAVEMARIAGKPIYVFDQERNSWYTYSYEQIKWLKTGTPMLTMNFAGIGTRQIKENGIQAIRDAYTKTFGNPTITPKQESKSEVFDLTKAAQYDAAVEENNNLVEDLGGGEIAKQQVQDAVAVAKTGYSLDEVTPVFSPDEISQIKQALNGKPLRVMSVSRFTDPAFFANDIIKFLEQNSKKPFTDSTRVNAIELWSKHDGMPIRNILEACAKYKVAPMVSFSITTLGDTALEKGVLKYQDLLPLIKGLIDEGVLDPRTTTVRLDPILVGVTNMEDIKTVVVECKKMGITKFVTSLVQSYGYLDGTPKDRKVTSGINNALAKEGKTYDWGKYYGYDRNGNINFKPKQQYIDEIGKVLIELNKDPEIRLETCAFTIKGLKASACLDPMIIERVTGIDVTRPDGTYDRDTSRPDCMCYGCHGDMFRFNEKKCYSSCAYCYAAHSGDSAFEYYNEDGTLKDRPLTRFKERKVINVYSGTGDNTDLSNFAVRPFKYQNVVYNTVEGAFQAQKLNYSNYIDSDMNDAYIKMQNKFAKATGSEARTMGRSISSLDRQSWDRDSEAILKEAMKASFEQNPKAKQRLLNTGDAIITHKNKAGEEQYDGKFSRLLMEIREEFRKENQVQSVSSLVTVNKEAVDKMVLYSKGYDRLNNSLNEMELDENMISSKIKQFNEALKSENINSEEQMEGLINRIICD